jgi:IS30 family transposase
MSRSLTQEQKERVWQLWAEGRSPRAIGREVGFWAQGVRNFVGHTGGVRPPERRRSERCLSKAEREEISRGLARGEGFRAIGRAISRHHTTVSREVHSNGGPERYRAQAADAAAWGRARRPKPSKLHLNPKLRAVVEEKLCLKWSPQQISRWLRRTTLIMKRCRSPTRRSTSRSSSRAAVPYAASSRPALEAAGIRATLELSAQSAKARARSPAA